MNLKTFVEEFIDYTKPCYTMYKDEQFPVFKNPTRKEVIEIRKQNNLSDVVRIVLDIDKKCIYAGSHNLLHRDIKKTGKVERAIFGLADTTKDGRILTPDLIGNPIPKLPKWAEKFFMSNINEKWTLPFENYKKSWKEIKLTDRPFLG